MHYTSCTAHCPQAVRPGRCARIYLPTGPVGHPDHPLGRTPRPPRPVCPVLHPQRPCTTLLPPPGQDSPSPEAGVPGSTSPQALQDTPTTPWARLPISPGWCARFYIPTGPSRHFDHTVGRTPGPPRPVCPVLYPHRPLWTLRAPHGQASPSPKAGVPGSTFPEALQDTPSTPWAGLPVPSGRCARFYLPTGPSGHSDHPLGRTPRPPRPVCPVLHPHRPFWTLRAPHGQASPSPQAGVPGSTSPQALQDTPTTPWAQLPVLPGRCARFYIPTGPSRHPDHPLGRTPRPPRSMCPVLPPHRLCRTLRALPGQDSPSPRAGVPESTSPETVQDTRSNPWARLPVPPSRCARFYIPTGPSGHSDQPLVRTPHPPGRCARFYIPTGPSRHSDNPMGRTPRPPKRCDVLPPQRPFRTLQPPPGQDSPSPKAGVPESTSPQALRDTRSTPWAGLPVPPLPVCPVPHPHRPYRTLRPAPGQDSPSPQAGVPGSTSPQAL